MYRPQFPICEAPEGFQWSPIVYQFDATNTDGLLLTLGIGEQTDDIPLVLDEEGDFYLCAMRVITPYEVLLKDPFTDPLSDGFVPAVLFADPMFPTVLEPPGLICPEGSTFLVSFRRSS